MVNPSIRRLRFVALGFASAVVALAASACSSSGDSNGTTGPLSEADFQSGLVAEQCSRIGMCCSAAMQPFDEKTCESQLKAKLFPNAGGGGGGGATGAGGGSAGPAVTYDADAAGKCLAEAKALPKTCGALVPSGPVDGPTGGPIHDLDPCQSVYKGTKNVGDACTDSTECAPGEKGFSYCSPTTHTCEAVDAVIKGTCGDDGMGKFYVCIPEGGDGIHVAPCENGFCYGIAHAGDPCITQATDTKCEAGTQCQSTNGGVNGTCVGLPKAGDPCMNGTCADGGYCDGANCVAQKDEGAACMSANECKTPDPCTDGKCAAPAAQLCTFGH